MFNFIQPPLLGLTLRTTNILSILAAATPTDNERTTLRGATQTTFGNTRKDFFNLSTGLDVRHLPELIAIVLNQFDAMNQTTNPG